MPEIWKAVPGYEGHYEVSNLGEVQSLKRGSTRTLSMSRVNRDGYRRVDLYLDNVSTTVSVHVLVARAFIGPMPANQEVRHLDGNPANNSLTNLRYGTSSQNKSDTVLHGKHHNAIKTHCSSGHEFSCENTYFAGRRRMCRTCNRQAVARYKNRKLVKA